MFLDAQTLLSDAQALTATAASTNIYDLAVDRDRTELSSDFKHFRAASSQPGPPGGLSCGHSHAGSSGQRTSWLHSLYVSAIRTKPRTLCNGKVTISGVWACFAHGKPNFRWVASCVGGLFRDKMDHCEYERRFTQRSAFDS